jgi:hypothetical protein
MGVVAPVSAVVATVVPLLVGLLLEGIPGMRQLPGFAIAIVAVLVDVQLLTWTCNLLQSPGWDRSGFCAESHIQGFWVHGSAGGSGAL